jgi:YHS domain-containing protein
MRKRTISFIVSILVLASANIFALTAINIETDSVKSNTHQHEKEEGSSKSMHHSKECKAIKTEVHTHKFKDVDIKAADACCSSNIIWNEVCPVMGNEVDPEANTVEYEGKLYGFCCDGCDAKFRKDPKKYSSNLSEDGKTFIGKKEKH